MILSVAETRDVILSFLKIPAGPGENAEEALGKMVRIVARVVTVKRNNFIVMAVFSCVIDTVVM
jgi:hypothetical protein